MKIGVWRVNNFSFEDFAWPIKDSAVLAHGIGAICCHEEPFLAEAGR